MSEGSDRRHFTDSAVRGLGLTPDVSTRRRRRILVGLGGALIVGGLFVPLVLGERGGPGGLIATLGLLAAIVGLAFAYGRLRRGVRLRALPAVETQAGVERAGAGFERAVRTAHSPRTGEAVSGRASAVDRLRSLAASAVAEREDADEVAGAESVRTGSATDDDVVAPLLDDSAEPPDPGGSPWPLRRERRSFARRVERAVAALAGPHLDGEWTPAWGQPGSAGSREAGRAPIVSRTGRWRGLVGVGLVALGIAAVTRTAGTALAAALLLGMAGYVRLADPPEPTLAVERSIETDEPRPGEPVTVSVTVENAGEMPVTDLRVVDGVPDGLAVVAGSPRHATALRPGSRTTFEYDVRAVYGEHDFEEVHAVTRDPSGERERAATVETPTATLTCRPGSVQEPVPLHPRTSGLTGRVPADVGGSGTEFHSVRAYRSGDPLGRVDWNRLARTGELATRQFREEHAATVVVLVDARAAAHRAPADDALSAVDRSLAGAAQVVETLVADGDRVGLASIGPRFTWVEPGGGRAHRAELRATLARDPAFRPPDPGDRFFEHRFERLLGYRLPADSQLLCFSPLLDDEVVGVLRRLHARGYPLSVFSPDPTTVETVGGTVARLERAAVVETVRAAGVRVVDWQTDEPLEVAVARARRGWRR